MGWHSPPSPAPQTAVLTAAAKVLHLRLMCARASLCADLRPASAAMASAGMHNDAGVNIDLYIPRKWCAAAPCMHAASRRPSRWRLRQDDSRLTTSPCVLCSSATNRLIHAKDKASVQLNIGHVSGALRMLFLPPAVCEQAEHDAHLFHRLLQLFLSLADMVSLGTVRRGHQIVCPGTPACFKAESFPPGPSVAQLTACTPVSTPRWRCAGSSARKASRTARWIASSASAWRMRNARASSSRLP